MLSKLFCHYFFKLKEIHLISYSNIFKNQKHHTNKWKGFSGFQQQPLLRDLLLYLFQLYIKKEKNPISISSQIPESALGIFRHRKALLNHLTFCFSFSLKHLFTLQSLNASAALMPLCHSPSPSWVLPTAEPLPWVPFPCRWNSCIPGSFVHDSTLSMSVKLLLGADDRLFKKPDWISIWNIYLETLFHNRTFYCMLTLLWKTGIWFSTWLKTHYEIKCLHSWIVR